MRAPRWRLGENDGEPTVGSPTISLRSVSASFDPIHHIDDVTAMVRTAGDLALAWFRQPLAVTNKLAAMSTGTAGLDADGAASPFDPVTEADRAVEDALRTSLAARFPHHEILGEEAGLTGSGDHRWIIDPIDGTRAFITGQPLWGTLLGLRHGDVVLAGWLHNPVLGETYVGAATTATMTTIAAATTTTLHTRDTTDLSDAIVLSTHPDMFAPGHEAEGFARLDRVTRMVRYSGDCMNYAYLASGTADLVVENGLASYDIAALIPIVRGAGGVITSLDGGNPVDGGYVVAAATSQLHAAALDVLNG